MVKSVERFGTEFEAHALSDNELFEQRHGGVVGGRLTRAGDGPGSIANRKIVRLTQNVLRVRKIIVDEIWTGIPLQDTVQVGTPLLRRIGRYLLTSIQRDVHGPAAGIAVRSIDLPTPEDAVQHGIHSAGKLSTPAKRQGVDVAELQNVRCIPSRDRSLQVGTVRVLQAGCASQPGDAVVGGRSIVDGFGPGVTRQELQTVGVGLLHANLQGMVDRAGKGRTVAAQRVELREGTQYLITRNGVSRERAIG